jgi:hypothetical protein
LNAIAASSRQVSSPAERLSRSRRCRRVQTAGIVLKSAVAELIRHLRRAGGFKIGVIVESPRPGGKDAPPAI